MRCRCVTLLLGLMAPVAGARAELPVGAPAPEIQAAEWLNVDEPLSLSRLNGLVVVLYFWVSFHEGGEQQIGLVNAIENNRALGRRSGVAVIGLTDADRQRVEPMLAKEKVFFPVGVRCEAYKDYRIERFPSVVVVDARGKVAFAGVPASAEEFVRKVQETLARTPPTRTHPLDAPAVHQKLDAARAALRQADYRSAFRAARDAFEIAVTGDRLKSACQEVIELIEALGHDRLVQADELVEAGRFEEAVRVLRGVAADFAGLDAAASAAARIESFARQHPQVAQLLKGAEREQEARARLLEAQTALRERRVGEAYEALQEVATEYQGTAAAAAAARIRERLEQNRAALAEVREYQAARECETWLSQARSYIRTGRTEKARELLRQIVEKYPDTSYGDEARSELGRLR